MSFAQYEYYDWSNLIDDHARRRMCDEVEKGIRAGKFWHNSPKYQTNWNVFSTPSQDFINLKMSFIWSCFAFLAREVKIQNIQSWSFMTSLKTAEDRETLWHHHNHNPKTTTISGVYYMSIPDDVDLLTAGTEFAPNGVEGDNKFITEWRTGHWIIYPGKLWHRPGIVQSQQDRYIVAADMEF